MSRKVERRHFLSTALRRGMYLSVGSMLILREKVSEFVEQAIERGQEVETEGKKLVQERRAQRRAEPQPTRVNVHVDRALERRNLPSRQDIEELENQIARLAQHVDELEANR